MSEYEIIEWKSENKEIIKKTKRKREIIDMREKNIEEELIVNHEKMYKNNKELASHRMASRDLVIQGLINPYLFENKYLDDINNQNEFLRPMDSNYKQKKE
jgi:hypothetical protein